MPIDEYNAWRSDNCRIAPEYVREANEELKKMGVTNAGFDNDGRAVAHSKKGRNGVLKYMGFVDKEAGYGDWSGV